MQRLWDNIKEKTSGKNTLILGFGREGRSTLRILEKYGGCRSIAISDINEVRTEYESICGKDYQKGLDRFDLIIKSPGIVLEDESIIPKITSQSQLFLEAMRDDVTAITGTKGKSTTATLLYHILKGKYKAALMGNIGIAAFDAAESAEEGSIFVYEMSSHQLEYTTVSPKRAVYINLYPEHLDHYGSFEKYKAAKENIYRYQKEGDILWCEKSLVPSVHRGDAVSVSASGGADIVICGRSIHSPMGDITINANDTVLVGGHNLYNIGIVYDICRRMGIGNDEFKERLKSYKPLPHRLQYVGTVNGARFFDDSISTICETAVQALLSIDNVGTVLIGGMDRGIDYSPLCEYLIKNPPENIILMYDTGKRIYDMINGKAAANIIKVKDLEEAVIRALELTPPGKSCVMSPAAASYGFFKNFEERGEKFCEYLKKYSGGK
ncbi:MAG: UDP-N-acetylmuramoyl-L-alanine--D-glutamate ligase [Oscillospiraceae bacterium]|nr:UDP-N-acetylmuramoyl-L-alanine--D-glutamate ligase [Oscillospiraceae bacterium]